MGVAWEHGWQQYRDLQGGGGVKGILGSVSGQSAGPCLLLTLKAFPPWSGQGSGAAQGKVGSLGTGPWAPRGGASDWAPSVLL